MGEDWRGRGGGRRGGQPTITGRSSWRGHGKGKAGTKMLGGLIPAPDAIASNPIAFKLANMAAYELRSHIEGLIGSWTGRGKGRMPGQPTVKPPSVLAKPRGEKANFGNNHILDPRAPTSSVSRSTSRRSLTSECSSKSSTTVFELEEGHEPPGAQAPGSITLGEHHASLRGDRGGLHA